MTAVADAIRTKAGSSESLAFPDGFVTAVEGITTGGGGSSSEGCVTVDSTCYPGYTAYSSRISKWKNLLELGSGADVLGDKITLDTTLYYLSDAGSMFVGAPDEFLLLAGSLADPAQWNKSSTGWVHDIEGLPSTTLDFELIGTSVDSYGSFLPLEAGDSYQIDGKVDFVPCLSVYNYGSYNPICVPMEGFITQDFSTTGQVSNSKYLKFSITTPVFPSCTVRGHYYSSITANVGAGVLGLIYATRFKKIE